MFNEARGEDKMHQRGIGGVGAVAAMVVAGLIVCGIIYLGPDIWRGIQEGAAGIGTTPLKSITQNPRAYENQQVVVIGKIFINSIVDDEGYYFVVINLPGNFIPDISSEYKASGKVIHVQTVPGTKEWAWALMYTGQENYWAIEISEVDKI